MTETSRDDISPPGRRGRRKRRRIQGRPSWTDTPSTSHAAAGGPRPVGWWPHGNDCDHSPTGGTSIAVRSNAETNGLQYLVKYSVLLESGGVTVAGQSTRRNRRLRRQQNRHRHWRTTGSHNDGDENRHSTKTTTRPDLARTDSMMEMEAVLRDTLMSRHLQSTDGTNNLHHNTSGPQHLLQVSCLFLPILAGAFWYWTKRRARKVATALGHDSACAAAADANRAGGSEGDYHRWHDPKDNPANDNDEVDEYCAWYAGHASNGPGSWNPEASFSFSGGSGHSPRRGGGVGNAGATTNSFSAMTDDEMADVEMAGLEQPASVLWIKGGSRQTSKMMGDIELVRASPSAINGPLMDECSSAPKPERDTDTAADKSSWQPIEDLYTLDVMECALDLSPSGHDSVYFTDPCTDACSIVGSSIAGIHMLPRFAPMTMDRGDRLRNTCTRSATPSPTGAAVTVETQGNMTDV